MIKFITLLSLLVSFSLFSSFQTLNNSGLWNAILKHVETQFGESEQILNEIQSEKGVKIDLIWSKIKINDSLKVNLLVTNGMSEKKMRVPKSKNAYERIELMMILPESWPISQKAFEDENNYWPIRLLKGLARYPFINNTWFDKGHTIETGPGSSIFDAVILLESKFFPNNLVKFKKKEIKFYLVAPLLLDEMDFKIENKYEGFSQLLKDTNIEVIDTNRTSLIK